MTIFRFSAMERARRGLTGGFASGPSGLAQDIFGKMLCAVALTFGAGPVLSQQMSLPSGLEVRLFEVVLEEAPLVARFRFVAPAIDPIGEAKNFGDVVADFQYLCDSVVVSALGQNDWAGEQVVLSLASAETEFGVYDEAVLQFFQPFKITNATCIWEDF
jgi:hypothetical protein